LIENAEDIYKACQQILHAVKEKSKEVVNPYLIRIQSIIIELQNHFQAILSLEDNRSKLKYHWSVIYRDGDTLDELTTLINHSTPVFISSKVDYIKQRLVFFTSEIVSIFGKRESLYIITPKFQELAKLW